jgi:hypothetical protein
MPAAGEAMDGAVAEDLEMDEALVDRVSVI